MNRIWLGLLSGVCLTFFVYPVSGNYYKNGVNALNAGKRTAAADNFKKALEKDSSNAEILFMYASVLDPSEAEKVYKKLAENTAVKDSIRAGSFATLGDIYYAKKQFKESASYFRKATKTVPNPIYRHKLALSSFCLGDRETAQTIWLSLSLEYGDNISKMAQYYLGLIHLKNADYDKAYGCFLKTGNADPENSWTIASLAGKLECAVHLGMAEKVEEYTKQLKPYMNNLLERDLLLLAMADFDNKKDTDRSKTADVATQSVGDGSGQLFTLQVGAFGSPENASNLQKKLSKNFENVTVFPVTNSDQVYYRVRVGSFSSREEADEFGKNRLEELEVKYQVVPK